MEKRDRDKLSKNIDPTEAGKVNRETSKRPLEESDSDVDFGQNIRRDEDLEDEPSRRPGNLDSSTDRSGSTGMGKGSKQIDESKRSGSSETEH